MNKLEQLISELCPDGVEWKTLGESFDILAGGDVPKEDLSEIKTEEFNIPILSNGIEKKALYGWTNKAKIDNPSLTISARGTIGWTSLRDKPFFPIVRLLVLTPKIELNLKYTYHFMKMIEKSYKVSETGIPQLTKPMIKDIEIPLPPLPVQEEIVRILDNFTELTAELTTELTTELTAWKKQYQYYRDSLLTFGNEVKWKELGNFGEIRMCKRILKEQTLDIGDIPFYKIGTFGKEPNAYIPYKLFDEYRSKYNYPKIGEVLISASGTIGRSVIFDGQDAYFQDSNIVWIETNETQVLNKYLFHSYKIARWIISEGGTIQRLYNNNLKKTKIPIPYPNDTDKSLLEQQRIVDILDRFDTLCNDIEIRLPAEIKARKQQYEYYRDKLLTFPKVDKGV